MAYFAKKNAGKLCNVEKEQKFRSTLQNLFDIAHGKIDEMIDESRRQFLTNQRKDGRIGYIGDIETFYDAAEKAQLELDDILFARLEKSQMEKESLGTFFSVHAAQCSSIIYFISYSINQVVKQDNSKNCMYIFYSYLIN